MLGGLIEGDMMVAVTEVLAVGMFGLVVLIGEIENGCGRGLYRDWDGPPQFST